MRASDETQDRLEKKKKKKKNTSECKFSSTT